jgi:hypothetical protein
MIVICEDESYVEAAKFYGKKLKIADDVIIGIKLYEDLNIAGYCERHDDEVIPYYMIGLDTSSGDDEEDPFSVLAHEMVHVRQYSTNELIDHGKYCTWKGKKFKEFDPNTDDYFFSPWEIEAFGMQVGLYRLYMGEMGQ